MKHLLDTKVGPYQAMIPMVDVDTIGAGGGSIAYVDEGGIFRVGPRSAGAEPGPACYDKGGTEPTATDAMVNLGWLPAGDFLGGGMALRADLARTSFERGPAKALDMTVEEASMGAVQILTHSMVQSIEENSVRKGFDPRDFALVAEGGAGPLFAAEIALEVGTPYVLVPPYPGVTAAMGLPGHRHGLRVRHHHVPAPLGARRTRAPAVVRGPGGKARVQLEEDGVPADRILIQRIAECRYVGQGYELRVDAESGMIDSDWAARLRSTSTTSTSASTRGASRTRTSRFRTCGSGDRADAAPRDARGRPRRPRCRRSAAPRGRGLVPGRRAAPAGRDALLRQGNAPREEPHRGACDRAAVRLDHGRPAGISAHVDRFGNILIEVGASSEARALAETAEVGR